MRAKRRLANNSAPVPIKSTRYPVKKQPKNGPIQTILASK